MNFNLNKKYYFMGIKIVNIKIHVVEKLFIRNVKNYVEIALEKNRKHGHSK